MHGLRRSSIQDEVSLTERAYPVNRVDERAGSSILRIEGRLVFAEAASLWGDLGKNTDSVAAGQSLHFDMSNVHAIDGGSMALLVQLRSDLHQPPWHW
jgi:ABC-type transporter Mla MlaB component